jgi:hypothetical protein
MSHPTHPHRGMRFAASDASTGATDPAPTAIAPASAPASDNRPADTKPAETKAEKFKRLATKRVTTVGEALDTLEKCFEPAGYEFTEDQIATIFNALQTRLAAIETNARAALKPALERKPALQIAL